MQNTMNNFPSASSHLASQYQVLPPKIYARMHFVFEIYHVFSLSYVQKVIIYKRKGNTSYSLKSSQDSKCLHRKKWFGHCVCAHMSKTSNRLCRSECIIKLGGKTSMLNLKPTRSKCLFQTMKRIPAKCSEMRLLVTLANIVKRFWKNSIGY